MGYKQQRSSLRLRLESSPGPFPPLSPPPARNTIHSRHESSPILIPSSPQPQPQRPTSSPSSNRHIRRESSPGLSLPPMSPPPTATANATSLHSRHDSCPGPFPLTPPETPTLFLINSNNNTNNNNTNNINNNRSHYYSPSHSHFHRQQQLFRHESDPGIHPSTSPPPPSSSSLLSPIHIFDDHNNFVVKRKFGLYDKESELAWPFMEIQGLDHDDIRETAYEVFFTACRSSPGFGGQSNLTFYSKHENNGNNGSGSGGHVPVSQTSRVKRALGLKMLKSSLSQRIMVVSSMPTSPVGSSRGGAGSPWSRSGSAAAAKGTPRRQMSMAEVMRVQMQVSEQSDSRLRKTLMRTLVGQLGRQAETIILPLELLRHLKPSEFNNLHEYHLWQKRQLKILEAGLLLHPSIPIENTNTLALNLKEIIRSGEDKPLDTSKNSDTMRTFSNSVVSLSMRSPNGVPTNVCHWANGYPVNIHLYISLLQSIFDLRDETLVLDEVDEMLELIKKTWSTLGINRPIHNLCLTWVLFQQYVQTGQIEPDLLCASHAMLNEVASDAKKEKDDLYVKILRSALSSLQEWIDKGLLNYHYYFQDEAVGLIENLLPIVLLASKILGDIRISDAEGKEREDKALGDSSGDKRVDDYIRSSLKNAFENIMEAANAKSAEFVTKQELSEVMVQLAQDTEDLAKKERESYRPVLKKWHTTAAAVAALTLNNCYGHVLKQYLKVMMTSQTNETVLVLQRARKLEDVLVQMVVEDSVDCEDGGKTIVREMNPFEVDSTIMSLVRKWIHESLYKGNDFFQRAKETETWNPKSKSEPYAKSVVEMINLAKIIVQEFFQIPIAITEDLVQELADGLQKLFREYTMFAAACGLKENYLPSLPPLTRCNRNSKFHKFWKIASPCSVSCEDPHIYGMYEANHPHSCTSRGTQRLYIRLNTLHYLLSQIPSLDKSLSLTQGAVPLNRHSFKKIQGPQGNNNSNITSYFETANSSILAACQHLSEVASYRLLFLDSSTFFYDTLYVGDVISARIQPALTILKHNIKLMTAILTERAKPLALKEVMKASFDAFLMVLLAGGTSRMFNESDSTSIKEDFECLKKLFFTCGEGLVDQDVVEKEAEVVEGVIALMGLSTEQLMENLSIVSSETSDVGVNGNGQKLPMPPTTGKWNRADPNTILRVLCYRNDRAANHFLKRKFQIAKRR